MKCKRYIYSLFAGIMIVATALLCGCNNHFEYDTAVTSSEYISFRAAIADNNGNIATRSIGEDIYIEEEDWLCDLSANDDGAITRGAPTTEISDNIGLVGYKFATGQGMNNSREPWADMGNREFVNSGDMYITESNPINWNAVGSDNDLKVYAYSPYDETMGSVTGYPTVSYTADADITKQTDIIVAEALVKPADQKRPIPLNFNHILTAVQFKTHFKCTVKSVTIKNIYHSGTYSFAPGAGWSVTTSGDNATMDYTVDFGEGKAFAKDSYITDGENTMMLIPQALHDEAEVEMVCIPEGETEAKTIRASLKGKVWKANKLITYILHQKGQHEYIYLDLAAENVTIDGTDGTEYTGAYYETKNGSTNKVTVTGTHAPNNIYHIYQSTDGEQTGTEDNRSTTGLVDGTWVLPKYAEVMYDSQTTWSEYITNNNDVEAVIHAWDNKEGTTGAVRNAKRGHTTNWIKITPPLDCEIIIDNIYSRYQQFNPETGCNTSRTQGSIAIHNPTMVEQKSTVTINYIGDNRLGCIHCNNNYSEHKLILQGTGSLTVADADFNTKTDSNNGGKGYYSNHWNSAIGNNDSTQDCYGIIINSGTLFAGTTRAENCTAIGAGGNGYGQVTINGGVVTAVASTTGTAIGGGIGFNSPGGEGYVKINGGNVYAYNKGNQWDIPSSAIGGAGSCKAAGKKGTVIINDGYVYAESALGTAIGGGSSYSKEGGDAEIEINGGIVVAKSVSALGGDKGATPGVMILGGAGIGGGSASTGGDNPKYGGSVLDNDNADNGGTATIKITGNPTIRTGSIGGGLTSCSGGKIGSAQITIEGGDIQAQFVMASGSKGTPSFKMTGGKIHNSDITDPEYRHVRDYGGAIYIEDGTCEISQASAATPTIITNCGAKKGGAVYIVGGGDTSFKMTGGIITNCIAKDDSSDGGAVYLDGGAVTIGGDAIITNNISNGGNGGGVCVRQGSFTMEGNAQITKNTTLYNTTTKGGNGGGVYVTSTKEVTVDIKSGSIEGNSASRNGGGVCVDMPNVNTASANVTIGINDANISENPIIQSNIALMNGGGLYISGAKSDVDIYDGTVTDNDVSSYVANEDVANEQGKVTLHSGNVTHVEIVFDGNGGTINNDGTTTTHVQKIVTATNSFLVTPPATGEGAFVRLGYIFKGWNTRKDAAGETYVDGQIVNTKAGFTLYAQWELDQ